jgi:hypothetical protein
VSRYKSDWSHEFIPGYEFGSGHRRSVATKAGPKADNSHGIGIFGMQMRVSGYNVMQVML